MELCAGSGAMGLGAAFMGAHVTTAIEKNSFVAEHFHRNDHGVVLEANVASPEVLALAHRALGGDTAWLVSFVTLFLVLFKDLIHRHFESHMAL